MLFFVTGRRVALELADCTEDLPPAEGAVRFCFASLEGIDVLTAAADGVDGRPNADVACDGEDHKVAGRTLGLALFKIVLELLKTPVVVSTRTPARRAAFNAADLARAISAFRMAVICRNSVSDTAGRGLLGLRACASWAARRSQRIFGSNGAALVEDGAETADDRIRTLSADTAGGKVTVGGKGPRGRNWRGIAAWLGMASQDLEFGMNLEMEKESGTDVPSTATK